MSLSGKVAIVTGGSKGIGRAISLHLASLGAKVVVNYSSDSSSADETISKIGKDQAVCPILLSISLILIHKQQVAIKADAGAVSEVSRLVESTISHFGHLDIVVACAGIMPLNELEKLREEEFDRVMNVNVKGPLFLAQVRPPLYPLSPFPPLLPLNTQNQSHKY